MPFKFKVAITTALGSCVDEAFTANSVQQISDNMPDDVTIYETTLLRPASERASVPDEEVFLDLLSMVGNIKEASQMTPEWLAENDANQERAMAMLANAQIRIR